VSLNFYGYNMVYSEANVVRLKSMVQSYFWEANSSTVIQEISHNLWNQKVHYSLPLVPTLSQMNPVHSLPPYISTMLQQFPEFNSTVIL
jgi:hypothetical protein